MSHPSAPRPTAATTAAVTASPSSVRRRQLLQRGCGLGGAALLGSLGSVAAWAAGGGQPEKTEVRIGFIPLTDCASVVMASTLGLDRKHGVKFVLSKEASWAGVRDKLVNGELDLAHVLYGLVYGVHLGLGGQRKDMAVLATLNQNGQAITLSRQLAEQGAVDGASLAQLLKDQPREYTFAQTFPTGTHAMWLYYWLGAAGIHPMRDVKTIVVPPPQMVANMRVGNMDGFCVGEPWGERAIMDNIGVTAITTQALWPDHPEKVLGATGDFVRANPNTARAATAAILEAAQWIDASAANRAEMARTIAARSYVNTGVEAIEGRIQGQYRDGLGKTWEDAHPMRFSGDGAVSYPYLSDGMWFLTQFKRWGLLPEHPDYLAVARAINQTELYEQAAALAGTPLPSDPMRSSTLFDGVVWDGQDPRGYADAFAVRA